MLNLGFLRPATADHRQFDRFGAVFVNQDAGLETGAEDGATGLAQLQGRGGVPGEDQLLHRHLVGGVVRHHLGHGVEDEAQPLRPGVVADPNAAAGDALAAVTVGVDDAEAGGAGAGIDTEDAMAQRLVQPSSSASTASAMSALE